MKSRAISTGIMASQTGAVVVILVMLASVPKTSGIPAFSRKYQTSCTTCYDDNHLFTPAPPATIAPTSPVTFSGGFVGANYWFYPRVIGTFHYDFVNSHADFINGTPASEHQTRNRFSPGFRILARANIKVVGEHQYTFGRPYADPATGNTLFFRPNTFQAGIDHVF